MNYKNLAPPAGDGATLIMPPFSEYGKIIENNRALTRDVRIGDDSLQSLAVEARRLAVDAALFYTRGLGLDPGDNIDPAGPIIASGHQPIALHPGLMLKQFALAREARRMNAVPLFFSVDSDEFKGDTVPAPVMDGCLRRIDHPLFPQEGKVIFEKAKVEPPEKTIQRLEDLRQSLSHPRLSKLHMALGLFIDRLKIADLENPNFTARQILLRSAWRNRIEGGFMELTVSRICGHKPFLKFAEDIIGRIGEFKTIYNGELARYRKEHKLRYAVNPFPDLAEHSGLIETPFWIVKDESREKLFARETDKGGAVLFTQDGGQQPLSDLASGSAGIWIRPRAIVLSIYLRLFVCDLFIHGVGGAKYDTVTDRIIKAFYGIEPPSLACVTGTAWAGIDADDPGEEIETVEAQLRKIEHHPETSGGHGELFGKLTAEKKEMVEMIRKPGSDRKNIGIRISKLNKEMSAILAPAKKRLLAKRKSLKRKQEERQVAQARDYPYFYYKPENIASLLD
ncbi:hypothetical protein MNBD_NITROSPINAE03-656 [hydrothermal vent metagenome]|uniref:Uncharacterized protein n=1 Tax=hydrothermal vent metagenome TaxID=652676 RepID=A0A3B1C4B3_9ZZZZ